MAGDRGCVRGPRIWFGVRGRASMVGVLVVDRGDWKRGVGGEGDRELAWVLLVLVLVKMSGGCGKECIACTGMPSTDQAEDVLERCLVRSGVNPVVALK